MIVTRILTLLSFLILSLSLNAQHDTTRMTLPQAEKMFLEKNLSLIAAKYNIDANQALISQAKLWDNPVLSTDQNIYDAGGGWFKHNASYGQVYAQVSQLIRTAGKRSKLAQLATDNTTLAKLQFEDVMRSLRYTLRSDFFEIDYLLNIKHTYDTQLQALSKLVAGFDEQFKAGNISLRENLRLKALVFGLQSDLVNLQTEIAPLQSEIKLLLQTTDSTFILPQPDQSTKNLSQIDVPRPDSLLRTALANRPDAKIAQTQLDYETHNLAYQRALAKPDVNVGAEFDQRSSYAPNYVGLAIGIPLPIFNRNQGNIKASKFNIQQQQTLRDQSNARIQNEVLAAYNKLKYFQEVNNGAQDDFAQQYDALFGNMLKSYQARQLNLLEFIDFAENYRDTKLKLAEQRNNLFKSVEDLNYTIATDLIKR
jgi:outer membrane protein, heavy metal efflux system